MPLCQHELMTTPSNEIVTIDDEGWARILTSHRAYYAETSPAYDEVLDQVTERVRETGDIGKADIGGFSSGSAFAQTRPGSVTS